MLRNFRSVFKGNQMSMTLVMGVVTLSMLIYLVPSGNRLGIDSLLARVYGRDITFNDYRLMVKPLTQRVQEQIKQRLAQSGLPDEQMREQLDAALQSEEVRTRVQQEALNYLMGERLLEELAEREGVVVTDEEVRPALEQELHMLEFQARAPLFRKEDGTFRPEPEVDLALARLAEDLGTPNTLQGLVARVRRGLADQKLRARLQAQVPLDEAWLAMENRARNEKISFEFVTLTPDATPVKDPGDAVLEGFLKAAGARFQQPPRRVLQYVSLDAASLGPITVEDAALKAAYESKKGQFAEFQAAQVFFRAANEPEFKAAMAKARELRDTLIKGGDFAKAAQERSEDPEARANGGTLDAVAAHNPVIRNVLLGLKPGEISQPVRSLQGVHLIRLEARKDKPFEEMKDSLQQQIVQERFAAKAKEKLEQLRKRAGDHGDLGPGARKLGLKLQTSAPLLGEPGETLEGVPDAMETIGTAMDMKVGEVSKVRRSGDRYLLFRVQEERPAAVPPLKEIRKKVLAAWQMEESRKQLAEKTRATLAASGGNLGALDFPKSQDDATLANLDLGRHPSIRKALLDTPVGQTTPLLWTPQGKLWVARIKARTPAPPMTFAVRRQLAESLGKTLADLAFNARLSHLYTEGLKRPGFSSLRGHLNGIYKDEALLAEARKGRGEE